MSTMIKLQRYNDGESYKYNLYKRFITTGSIADLPRIERPFEEDYDREVQCALNLLP